MPSDVSLSDTLDTAPATSAQASASTHWSWTDGIPRTPHNILFLQTDYTSTSLGPKESWGPALRSYASMVFADTRGAGVLWGPNLVALYNEGFAICTGAAHPEFMGRGLYELFPETRSSLGPVLAKARETHRAVDVDNIELYLERFGYVEETYFIGQYIPLRGDGGEIEGFYNTVFESTAQVLSDRRRRVLDLVAAIPPLPVGDTLTAFVQALQTNPRDVTTCILYAFDETIAGPDPNLHLRASAGIPMGHTFAPEQARLETCSGNLVQAFRRAISARKMITLSYSEASMQGISWVGHGEPSKLLAICPLVTGQSTLGFYVQGINPRRPFDEVMKQSVEDLARQLEAKWASSISKQDLEQRQQALEQRASDSEKKLRNLAKSAPVGMVQVGVDSKIEWANEQFYEITGHDRSRPDMAEFREVLAEEERASNLQLLTELLGGAHRETRELRLARRWTPPVRDVEDAEPTSAWILAMCFPQMSDGKVQHLLGYVTDISHQKWAETIQTRNAVAANLAKQRQEEFIDVTCHEMRNPLSAIMQLADSIATSAQNNQSGDWESIAVESAASASTIAICAAHQKRVIDDVLMLSRLGAEMLTMSPDIQDPATVVADTVAMFQGETALNETEIVAQKDASIYNLNVDAVLLDSSRLVQVLVNLISNAIKFLTSRPTRKIVVRYGAHKLPPPSPQTPFGNLIWIGSAVPARPFRALSDLGGGGDVIYLHFVVEDNGPGIPSDQMQKLFKRFSQAAHRSHINYGGSGLGLYICRQLVETQGGRVGAASEQGKGSAFAFYIESRYAQKQDRSPPLKSEEIPSSRDGTAERKSPSTAMSLPTRNSVPPRRREMSSSRADATEGRIHILLVEDNLINQKVLAKQLRNNHCDVIVANHGQEALQILEMADCWQGTELTTMERSRVDLILMDVEMPVMNGLDCARRIRQWEQEGLVRHVPILAVTSNARQEQQDLALEAGMTDVLSKPVTVHGVLQRVRKILGREGANG